MIPVSKKLKGESKRKRRKGKKTKNRGKNLKEVLLYLPKSTYQRISSNELGPFLD